MRDSIRRYWALAAGTLLASTLTIHPATETTHASFTFDREASARSSGGRSGGGSFRSTPSRSTPSNSTPSRSTPSNSSPSRSTPSNGSSGFNSGPSYQGDRYYNGGGTVIVPVPVGPGVYNDPYRNDSYRNGGTNNGSTNGQTSTASNDGDWLVGLIILGVTAIVIVGIAYFVFRAMRSRGGFAGKGELDNDIITVSKIQVALLAEARAIQAELTDLSLEVDTDTSDGLLQLVQEASLALLRMPENWTHVLTESQTVKSREAAEALFNQISIAERSKFSVETLTNVGGRINQRTGFKPDPDEDPAAYIVVTLLVGTAHDKPLFDQVRTEADLSRALEQLAALPSDYLMTFELLWSPQDSADSLTYDELLTEYTNMIQL